MKLLATSRERLHLAGETTYPCRALALPEPTSRSRTRADRYEAVRLFLDRAVEGAAGVSRDAPERCRGAEICRRVEGIPLAIELAAARARVLSVEKIAERLSDRFRLLTRGDRPRCRASRRCAR